MDEFVDRLLREKEVAEILNVSTRTLRRYRTAGKIGFTVVNGMIRYKQSDVVRFIEERTTAPREASETTLAEVVEKFRVF